MAPRAPKSGYNGGINRRDFCLSLPLAGAVALRGPETQSQPAPAAPFLYILRFTMAPGFHEEERLDALLSFCREARIDDVAFIP